MSLEALTQPSEPKPYIRNSEASKSTSYSSLAKLVLVTSSIILIVKLFFNLVSNIVKILGSKDYYVNGYFSYDSKKSGGVTLSNLRISKSPINAPYYVTKPSLVVITKDEYLRKFNMLDNIKENGTLIINTSKSASEINSYLTNKDKKIIKERNISLNIIDAATIADKVGIKGKISKIIEMLILTKLNINNAYELLCDSIKTSFKTKGENIINSNIKAIEEAVTALKEITITDISNETDNRNLDVISKINNRLVDNLTVG